MKLPAPNTCRDVDPAFVAAALGFQPAVAYLGYALFDRLSFQNDRGRHAQKRLRSALVIDKVHVPDAIKLVQHRDCAAKMLGVLLPRPSLREQACRSGRSRSRKARVENEGLDAAAAGIGGGLRAKQTTADNQQNRQFSPPSFFD